MNLGILPNLTKDYILSNITQEQIFEHYLGIPVEIDRLIKVPSILRIDKNPTASFYYNINGKLRFRDLGGGFWGDCFDLVGYLSQINANNKKGFILILEKIAKDFALHKYSKEYLKTIKTINIEAFGEFNKKTKKIIELKIRPFNNIDASFWIKGNIKKKGLY